MSKRMSMMAVGSVFGLSVLGSASALADVSANAAVTSNYVFRGFTQTDDGPAVQGGIDYTHNSGIYAGTWASNVDEGFEVDLYLGYAGEVSGFGYDVGYISYEYTDDAFFDGAFRELYVGGSYGPLSLKYFDGTETAADTDYTYIDLGLEFELPQEVAFGLHYGVFNPDTDGEDDVVDYAVSVGKNLSGFDFAVAYTTNDLDEEDTFFVTVSKDFDL